MGYRTKQNRKDTRRTPKGQQGTNAAYKAGERRRVYGGVEDNGGHTAESSVTE